MNNQPPAAELAPDSRPSVFGPPTGAGLLLKQAREQAGLHIAALAVALKVPVRRLEALEAERWDHLPDPVFVRGLASSVCRSLKLDPTEVLSLLPQTAVPQLRPDEWGINAPFKESTGVSKEFMFSQLSRPAILLSLVLLAGALVIILFPNIEGGVQASGLLTSEAVTPSATAPVAAAALGAGATPRAADPLPIADAPMPTAPPVVTPARPDPLPGTSGAALAGAPAPALPTPQPVVPLATPAAISGAASGPLVFRMRNASWVEVVDAKGVIQVRRIVQAGESLGVSGELPLAVVVGRADATEVQVKGKPFSLDGLARDNVARFEVK